MSERHLTASAVYVVLERDEKIFLLRRAHTGWNDGKWILPSGHVEKDESVKTAAVREVQEEAGVHVREEDLVFLHTHYVHDVYTNFYFKTAVWEGEPSLNEPECSSEVGWFRKDALPEDTVRHVREMLSAVVRAEYFSETMNDPGT